MKISMERHGIRHDWLNVGDGYYVMRPGTATRSLRFRWEPEHHVTTYVDVEKLSEDAPCLVERGWWVGAHITARFNWPMEPHRVRFEGKNFIVLPKTDDALPAVFLASSREKLRPAQSDILRFLSAWAWMEGGGALVKTWTSGPRQSRSNVLENYTVTSVLDWDYLPENLDSKQRLALSLFHEGQALNHPAYQFLSFFKVLNLTFPEGDDRKIWVTNEIARLRKLEKPAWEENKALDRIKALEADSHDVGAYLWKSCRCAVAHAKVTDQVVDPDNLDDHLRMTKDLPLIRQLAAVAIRDCLSVPDRSHIWRTKPYALEGFRACMPDELVGQLDAGATLGRRSVEIPTCLELRATCSELPPFPMKELTCRIRSVRDGRVRLALERSHSILQVDLDFPANAIAFDPLSSANWMDDGTSYAMRARIDMFQFIDRLLRNGSLEIWEAEKNLFLGKTDAYIPVNMYYSPENAKAQLTELEAELKRREEAEASPRADGRPDDESPSRLDE